MELQLVESSARSVRLLSVSVDKFIKRSVLPTLETALGQMAPPKSGRVQECHLNQVAFQGVAHFWEMKLALMLSPWWFGGVNWTAAPERKWNYLKNLKVSRTFT